MERVVIIDYGLGNLNSVKNALDFIGYPAIISNKKEDIENADYLILPGVGAFSEGMKNLQSLGLIEILKKEVLEKKKPILGICLGMQLLAEESEENGIHKGLGFIKGKVERLKTNLRLPQVGWNNIIIKKDSILLKELPDDNFYFVHSFAFQEKIEDIVTSTCNYGNDFAATIQKDNIFGTQFHPEKSHISGIKLIRNFLNFKKEEKK